MTHHTDAQLLPCPFCGSEAHFEMDDFRWEWIECGSCGMQGNRSASLMEDCKPKLAEAWNRRAPAAPASEPELEAALDAMDKEVARMQPDRSVHWIGFTHDDRLRVVAAALAAAPQPPENQTTFQTEVGAAPQQPDGLMRENPATKPEAAPVQLPEPIGEIVHVPEYDDGLISWYTDSPPLVGIKIYTEQQVRELLAAHGIQERST